MDVIVVGGGVAGLVAARTLAAKSISAVVLEARDRLGGRVFTAWDDFGPYELGAEFVHGDDPELEALLAGLEVVDVSPTHHARIDESLVRDEHFWETVEQFVEHVRGRSGPVEASLASFAHPAVARSFVEGFHAADPARFSAEALVHEEDVSGERMRRLPGGYHQLVERLAEGVSVQLETVVHEIHHGRGHVRVVTDRGPLEARAAIVTVPVPLIAKLRFQPELPEVYNAARAIGFGDVARVVVRLPQAAWPADASFLHDLNLAFPVWWTEPQASVPTIVGWAGGPAVGRIPREFRERIATRSLRALLGAPVVPSAVHTHGWADDPFAVGAYSWIVAGAEDAPARLARPVDDTLFFAGEALAVNAPRGTVQAAIESGRRAAQAWISASG